MSGNVFIRTSTKLLSVNSYKVNSFAKIRNFIRSSTVQSQEQIFDVLYSDKPPEISKDDVIEIREKPQQKVVEKGIPIIKCKRPELNHYKNQKYEKHKIVPLASAGWNHHKSKGDYFTINMYSKKEDRESYFWNENVLNFHDVGLNKDLVESLEKQGIVRPTKIQVDGIPTVLTGRCCIIAAETGCGKTLTYLLPIMQQMVEWKSVVKDRPPNHPLALIVTPGRELANQIMEVSSQIGSSLLIDSDVIIGGHLKRAMLNPKFQYVDILVATVGALSKLTSSGIYNLSHVKHIVLDEADTLLDDSFSDYLIHTLRKIPFGHTRTSGSLPMSVQLTLASATMPTKMPKSLESLVPGGNFTAIQGDRLHHIVPHVPQHFCRLRMTEKPGKLLSVVRQSLSKKEPIMVFSNRSPTCNWASMFMNENGIKACNLNGDMPFEVRAGKFEQFQSGEFDVISCTDIGSRGLDTKRVKHVLNYDFPLYIADYIHRCGRTGRIGMDFDCQITNFITGNKDVEIVQQIETSIRKFSTLPNVTGNITRIIQNRIMRNSGRA